jgi:hypothetical protein
MLLVAEHPVFFKQAILPIVPSIGLHKGSGFTVVIHFNTTSNTTFFL